MPIRHIAIALVLSLCTAGCNGLGDKFGAKPSDKSPQQETPQQQIDRLRRQVVTLQREKALLAGKLAVIEPRQRRMEEQLRDLKFATKRQAEQIASLANAPVQRDHYKKIGESLALKVNKLQQANLELNAQLLERTPAATTRPATRPTTRRADRH